MQIIKWTSLVLIFILANLIGSIGAKKYVNREKELKELKIAINILESKIRFTYEPLKEIFFQISRTLKTNIKVIFTQAGEYIENGKTYEIWNKSINEAEKMLNLTVEDLDILKDMGKMLGKTDVEGQIAQIKITSNFLDKQIEKAEEEKRKNEKLCKSLGAITGLIITIILI